MRLPWFPRQPFVPGSSTPPPNPPGTVVPWSLRNFVQQFSDLTAIVGSQLDRGVGEVVARYNALQPRDLGLRWVEQKYVFGFTPCNSPLATTPNFIEQTALPFCGIHNANTQIDLDHAAQNPYRLRGTFNPGLSPNLNGNAGGDILAWTNALHFTRPTRIVGVNLVLASCPSYQLNSSQNPWVYGASPPLTKNTGEPLDDFFLDLSIDSQFAKNNSRWLAEPEVQRHRWNARQFATHPQPRTQTGNPPEMEPAYGTDTRALEGLMSIDARNLRIDLNPGAVARLAFTIPAYPAGDDAGWNFSIEGTGRESAPWANQSYSLTLTTLEAMR